MEFTTFEISKIDLDTAKTLLNGARKSYTNSVVALNSIVDSRKLIPEGKENDIINDEKSPNNGKPLSEVYDTMIQAHRNDVALKAAEIDFLNKVVNQISGDVA